MRVAVVDGFKTIGKMRERGRKGSQEAAKSREENEIENMIWIWVNTNRVGSDRLGEPICGWARKWVKPSKSSMAESGSYNLGFRLDIKQILLEAQHRWLRPAEICEILRNYEKFHISPEAPTKPVSGSVFLFDRKVLRYFRKDGHNWRKKRDAFLNNAVVHIGSSRLEVLICCIVIMHMERIMKIFKGAATGCLSRIMHIVFVHYLEVKGNKTNISGVRNNDRVVSNSENESSLSSSFRGTSPTSTLSSAYEDAESEGNHQASSRFHSYPESPLTDDNHSAQSSSYNQLFNPGNQNVPALNYASLLRGTEMEILVETVLYLGLKRQVIWHYGKKFLETPLQALNSLFEGNSLS
ncbi:UNVERIFIED_CONTAM: Calmodulin-binding transcription activator 1 [Sesamum calycinum]|uniref:Calmodulin-binding transcription activator 1 n=1 Tax=Sesamum calycinum TaxID=2727403 RepID=A0AAW2R7M9_9LAMI